jgi:hypothetical protein
MKNWLSKRKLFLVLFFLIFILANGFGQEIHFDGPESSGYSVYHGLPLIWRKTTEISYIDGESVRDIDSNFIFLGLNLLLYAALSAIIVNILDVLSLFSNI